MTVETDNFIIDDTIWNYIESREITGNRMRPPPVKGGLKSLNVTCKGCTYDWTARQYGDGRFSPYIGGVILTCPSCSVEGRVELRLLA